MKKNLLIMVLFLTGCMTACTQPHPKMAHENTRMAGGPCEGCDAIDEYGSKKLTNYDTLPDYHDAGPRMEVSGTIYKKDGKTPAQDVILYIYHTDQQGEYPTKGDETGWARRHGFIRGWIKTGADGAYRFHTLKPAAYPGRQNPAHIHATLKEPGVSAYWIDEYLFDDDPILSDDERAAQRKRGGSGIIRLIWKADGTILAHRDIVLGMNIPGYD